MSRPEVVLPYATLRRYSNPPSARGVCEQRGECGAEFGEVGGVIEQDPADAVNGLVLNPTYLETR